MNILYIYKKTIVPINAQKDWNCQSQLCKKIFVYNIWACFISISDTVSDGPTKTLVLNIERAQGI